jgi:hypothetical protein
VNAVKTLAASMWLWWSQTAITFDQGDHPNRIPYSGRYPLMVSPIVGTMHQSKVLMNGDSDLNILYANTLDRMKIPRSSLGPSKAPFNRIILGKEGVLLGWIRLNVTFGQSNNF